MYLYEAIIGNGLEFEEVQFTELMVAESLQSALLRAEHLKLEYFESCEDAYAEVRLISEVDGYKINLTL